MKHRNEAGTLRTGDLAYYDTFTALVPCRIQSIHGFSGSGTPSTNQIIRVRLTASRGAYRRGETFETNGLHAIPRGAVYTSGGRFRIRAYQVVAND